MDFKSLMSAQIAKSKPPSKSTASTSSTSTSKYQRRADAEKEREAAYIAEQAKVEAERQERLTKKRKLEDEEAERNAAREEKRRKLAEESRIRREVEEAEEERRRRKRLGLPEVPRDGEEERPEIDDEELRIKLKELKEPETTNDEETHEQRLSRYYKLTSSKSLTKKRIWYPGPIPTTIEPLPTDDIILPAVLPPESDTEGYIKLHRQISTYLNFLLSEWSTALAARSKEDATSQAGVQASNNYKLVLADLTPLMRRLEAAVDNPPSKSKPPTTTSTNKPPSQSQPTHQPLPYTPLLQPLTQILHLTQIRHYRSATDAYLRLSIGKAAWPIGVTMVGIHERSAREKLHEDGKDREVAHIMSDEVTRRWLQSLKRCVSFAQGRWEVFEVGELMG